MLVDEVKIGVLAGSLLSALIGFAVLRFAPQKAIVTVEPDRGEGVVTMLDR